MLSALMTTESRFSEILPSRNLLTALEPIGLSRFCEKVWYHSYSWQSKDILDKTVCFLLGKTHFWLQGNFIFHSVNLKILIKFFHIHVSALNVHGHSSEICSQKLSKFF